MLFSQRTTTGDCHDAKDTILIKHNEKCDVDKDNRNDGSVSKNNHKAITNIMPMIKGR